MLRNEDVQLTEHFSLFELTTTSNASLLQANRTLSDDQVEKLRLLAEHAENVRNVCESPIIIHSGYRSSALNGATIGSSSTSQHPKCEAIDFHALNQTTEETFDKLLAAARSGLFRFGQLILERAERDYGTAKWVHCSIIGTLAKEKVGQVLKMEAGLDGKPKYVLVDQIKFPE